MCPGRLGIRAGVAGLFNLPPSVSPNLWGRRLQVHSGILRQFRQFSELSILHSDQRRGDRTWTKHEYPK